MGLYSVWICNGVAMYRSKKGTINDKLRHNVNSAVFPRHNRTLGQKVFLKFIIKNIMIKRQVIIVPKIWVWRRPVIPIPRKIQLAFELSAFVARICRFKGKDALKIGVGMMTRGEVALIVAQKGLSMNLIDPVYFTAVILLIIVSSISTPIVLKFLYSRDKEENGVQTA